MNRPFPVLRVCLILLALLLAAPVLSCGSTNGDETPTATSAVKTVNTVADQAARLAAVTQLRSAQSAQDTFFLRHQKYAATAAELRTAGVPVNPRVKVVAADASSYEMSVEVSGQDHTELIIRKTDTRVEHTDSNGDAW